MSQATPPDSAIQNELKLVYSNLNRVLQPKGVTIKLMNPKGDVYPILLEAAEAPEQKAFFPIVQQEISKLNLSLLNKFAIYGRKLNTQAAAWNMSLQIDNPKQEPESKPPAPASSYSGKVPLEFFEQIRTVSEKVIRLKDSEMLKNNEQATKSALIVPLIQTLGYDTSDPMEVYPEFGADAPDVKGQKVDYAILRDEKPIILIECKSIGENLNKPHNIAQLFLYFNATHARFGLLTNGVIYKFFTDIEKVNIMDSKPFFEFNMLEHQEGDIAELRKFSKSIFQPNDLKDNASDLKYTNEIKKIIAEQFAEPSPEFIKFFLGYGTPEPLYDGVKTQAVVNKFSDIVKRSLNQFLNEWVKDKFQSVIEDSNPSNFVNPPENSNFESDPVESKSSEIETTQEELEAFYIVKSILSEVADLSKISYTDTVNYFNILFDKKTTKCICRLWLNNQKKYISFYPHQASRKEISSIDDIFKYSKNIKEAFGLLPK
ncbi:type I restriction endonuclease [Pseudanabaena galeata UHCC 0370]|uniref:Type I restriction endonuclease n=1 Tax=Pseudanabaena galeata UHCC 0370 TaxID=3110310 RepID=A0ABU5TKR8_9CYAN|nr:type I restriction endonuclease [Pseudanabaena galeata]MEA5478847.1 type I restriction endonuclease [Pseudanabaena galeata UHCC 0370]